MVDKKIKTKAEDVAVVRAYSLPISTKISSEICTAIRNKTIEQATRILNDAIAKKRAIPYHKRNKDVGHKPGNMVAGRYPQKASGYFLQLFNTVKANAADKGLSTEGLIIIKAIVGKAAQRYKSGRQRGVKGKSTHIEIEVKESK